MNNLSRIVIVLAVSCVIAGCAPPIGSLGGEGASSGVTGDVQNLRALPMRETYDIPDKFQREIDLYVIGTYRGFLQEVPLDQVDIYIVENTNDLRTTIIDPPNKDYLTTRKQINLNTIYPFENKGIKAVCVVYKGLESIYYIDVKDPFDMGGPGGGNNNGEHGIEIIWDY